MQWWWRNIEQNESSTGQNEVIFGTHGVEMLNQYGEYLHTAINILWVAEKLMEVGGWLEGGLLISSYWSKGAGCRPLVLVGW